MPATIREILRKAVLQKKLVDRFLDPKARNWAKFDAELGYTLRDSVAKDGVDGSYTFSTYSGARRMINFAGRPCRINTYGDSFTQCHQVSDGETWQEHLAAHLGEPIRNFGIGGYGFYQAYRRLLREERTASAAEYLILNIYDDDHVRSVTAYRWLHLPYFHPRMIDLPASELCMFHGNPWVHLRLNLDSGRFEEQENSYSMPESLYQLCDEEHVYEIFGSKFDIQAFLAQQGAAEVDLGLLRQVAEVLDLPADLSSQEAIAQSARTLLQIYSLRASEFVVGKARAFARERGKKLMILLSYSSGSVIAACQGQPRFDQTFVDFLRTGETPFVDTLEKHAADFSLFRGTPEEYAKRYYIGHYNPQGNHFFAYAVKNALVDWLEPKPPAYRAAGVPQL